MFKLVSTKRAAEILKIDRSLLYSQGPHQRTRGPEEDIYLELPRTKINGRIYFRDYDLTALVKERKRPRFAQELGKKVAQTDQSREKGQEPDLDSRALAEYQYIRQSASARALFFKMHPDDQKKYKERHAEYLGDRVFMNKEKAEKLRDMFFEMALSVETAINQAEREKNEQRQ